MSNKKALLLIISVIILFMGLVSYVTLVEREQQPSIQKTEAKRVEILVNNIVSSAKTEGNHSYIQINIAEPLGDIFTIISKVKNEFEKKHPELEIYNWQIIVRTYAPGQTNFTYGIFVDHRPKKFLRNKPIVSSIHQPAIVPTMRPAFLFAGENNSFIIVPWNFHFCILYSSLRHYEARFKIEANER